MTGLQLHKHITAKNDFFFKEYPFFHLVTTSTISRFISTVAKSIFEKKNSANSFIQSERELVTYVKVISF